MANYRLTEFMLKWGDVDYGPIAALYKEELHPYLVQAGDP